MKFIAIFAVFVLANCEFDPETFDWSTVKPITHVKEYRDAYPWRFAGQAVDETVRVFNRNGRIVRGDIVAPGDYPWSAGVLISFTTDNGWCSGSLVSRNYVLSAAQCLIGSETQVTVLLAASDISRVGEILMVTSYQRHESFNNNNFDNDIALLRLQRMANINANSQVVRLPNLRQRTAHFENQKVFTPGWGSTGGSNDPIPTQHLRAVQASVISNASCRIRYLRLRDFNICTDTAIGTPCEGDEGSPLTTVEFDNVATQIGIYSYVNDGFIRGCDRGSPPVYTRTTDFLDWIQENSDVVIRTGFE